MTPANPLYSQTMIEMRRRAGVSGSEPCALLTLTLADQSPRCYLPGQRSCFLRSRRRRSRSRSQRQPAPSLSQGGRTPVSPQDGKEYDQFAEADTISDKLRPEEVVHPADHCVSPHRKNNCLGPVPDYEQIERSGNPDSRRADQRQDARQDGSPFPRARQTNPKNPEHDAAQRTLDQGDPKP